MHRRYTEKYYIVVQCSHHLHVCRVVSRAKTRKKFSSYGKWSNVLQQFLVDFVKTKTLKLSSMSLVLTLMYVHNFLVSTQIIKLTMASTMVCVDHS